MCNMQRFYACQRRNKKNAQWAPHPVFTPTPPPNKYWTNVIVSKYEPAWCEILKMVTQHFFFLLLTPITVIPWLPDVTLPHPRSSNACWPSFQIWAAWLHDVNCDYRGFSRWPCCCWRYKTIKTICIKTYKTHRPECYCLLRHVLTAPDFRMRSIIICMFRTSRLWLVRRPCLWEYLGSLRDSTAVNRTVGSVKQISRCD